jgi:hypothetical protein
MHIEVTAIPIGTKLHRLELRADGKFIGEYERSQAADIERKRSEIACAEEFLLHVYRNHGEFKVRWNRDRREKIVFASDSEVGLIPRQCWKTPSWAT